MVQTDITLRPIYVAGYPKSGTTWLTRLLGDALNCPTGASIPSQDENEPASGGWDRPGEYVVRKGHYRLVGGESYAVVPRAHTMYYEMLTNEPVFFIVRDPRDIAMSASHFHNKPIAEIVDGMVDGGLYGLPPWGEYVYDWLEYGYLRQSIPNFVALAYETLLADTFSGLCSFLSAAGLAWDADRLRTAVSRQSFTAVRERVAKQGDDLPGGATLNRKLLRKGQVGDWREQLAGEPLCKLEDAFRKPMTMLGYLED